MKEEIINSLGNPGELEKLYREDKTTFKRTFNLIFPDIRENTTAQIWNERLNFEAEEISWGSRHELAGVVILSCIGGLIAKLPDIFALNKDYFYSRNIAFVIFPLLTTYFAWKQKVQAKKIMLVSSVILFSAVYMNMLPGNAKSDTLLLACIHLPLFMWALLGFTFTGDKPGSNQRRLDFLRYNGDLLVMTAIIMIAGAMLTVVTFGLFELINIPIKEFYMNNIVIIGLPAAPIVGTYLVQSNPQLVNKVSPVIARIFTPLVFVMLTVYLIAVIYTGKDPFNDRNFLLIFNALLIGVMAIILFSIAENSKNPDNKAGTVLLLGLAIMTIIVNGIALSAIIFRISEWGMTPNRLAVLGGNILILANLLAVTWRLFKTLKNNNEIASVENSIASYLPIYIVWTILVTFIFPFAFGFK